jgi:hypothetical protein
VPATVLLMRGGLPGGLFGLPNPFFGQRRPNRSWENSRRATLSASGSATARQSTFTSHGTRLRAAAAVRTGVPVGTAFGAEGIATGSANALTDATITVANPVPGRDGETFPGLFDPADAGAEGNP